MPSALGNDPAREGIDTAHALGRHLRQIPLHRAVVDVHTRVHRVPAAVMCTPNPKTHEKRGIGAAAPRRRRGDEMR